MPPDPAPQRLPRPSPGPTEPAIGGRRVLPLILGMHRSGTSMTAGCLHRLGVDMVDDAVTEHESNRGGHYERVAFMVIHDRLLADLGSRWDFLAPLAPGWWRTPPAMVARREIKTWLKSALPDIGRRLWGIKDPRLMRLLPLWLDVCVDLDLEPRILLVTRDPDAVARSLERRNGMPRDDALALWLTYHMDFIRNVGDLPWLRVDHRDWLEDKSTQVHRLITYLGIIDTLSDNAVAAIDDFVRAEWTDYRVPPRPASSAAQSLYERLNSLADSSAPAPVVCAADLRAGARDFHAFAQAFRGALTRGERLSETEAGTQAATDALSLREADMPHLSAEPAAARKPSMSRHDPNAAARREGDEVSQGPDDPHHHERLRLERLVADLTAERDRTATVTSSLMAELADARSIATSLRICLTTLETERRNG